MKLKGLSTRELKSLENKLKSDISDAEENIISERNRLKTLRNDVGQVRARRRQLEYKERIRTEFLNLQIH